MPRFACIDQNGNVLWSDRNFAEKPADPIGKGWRIVPVIEERPALDVKKQRHANPSVLVGDGIVVEVWQVEDLPPLPAMPDLPGIVADLLARVERLEEK